MRPSQLKHPVAVLRKIIGLGQKELADLIGCSISTLQSIELGPERLALSAELAQKIAEQTGVSVQWLAKGDPSVRPSTWNGGPYDRAFFEYVRAEYLRSPTRAPTDVQQDWGTMFYEVFQYEAVLFGMFLDAYRNGNVFVLLFKLQEAVSRIEGDFPVAQETEELIDRLHEMRSKLAGAISSNEPLDLSEERWLTKTAHPYLDANHSRIKALLHQELVAAMQAKGSEGQKRRRPSQEARYSQLPTSEELVEMLQAVNASPLQKKPRGAKSTKKRRRVRN